MTSPGPASRHARTALVLGPLLLGCLLAGCFSGPPGPDLAALYNRSAQYHGVERNPVILIPGVLGSKLTHTPSGQTVWGAFSGDFANPETPAGARLVALPMEEDAPLATLRDSVRPDGALDQVKLDILGLPIKLGAYVDILRSLGIGGYRDESGALGDIDYGDEHFTCFQFDYDWRRSNAENAQRLHAFIQQKRAYVQREYARRFGVEDYDVQFDIVAHSMGGLLTRYYLRYGPQALPADGTLPTLNWAGTRFVEQAVLVGTPSAGSANALDQLVHGKHISRFVPDYAPAILGTMPATYELLPRGRHGALVDAADTSVVIDSLLAPSFWTRMEWGLAAPDQDPVLQQLLPHHDSRAARRQVALDHLTKSLRHARQFTAALDTPAPRPDSLTLMLIAGDAEETRARLQVDRRTGTLAELDTAPGDGTVLRQSALMDERTNANWSPTLVSPVDWSHVTFLFAEHIEMTSDPAFTDNLLYYLLVHPH